MSSDDTPQQTPNKSRPPELDSAGVYFMSIEDFESRKQPVEKQTAAKKQAP